MTQSAIRRKKDGENVAQEGSKGREDYGTLLGALTSPVSF